MRLRKAREAASGDKADIDNQAEPAMCCQIPIPPYHELPSHRTSAIRGNGPVIRVWLSFVTGVVLLSLSLASAIWLASRLA